MSGLQQHNINKLLILSKTATGQTPSVTHNIMTHISGTVIATTGQSLAHMLKYHHEHTVYDLWH